jgi:hypothetical protein
MWWAWFIFGGLTGVVLMSLMQMAGLGGGDDG